MSKKISWFKSSQYRSRTQRIDYINKPDNLYAKDWFGKLAVWGFVIIDLLCLKTVWNLVQTEDALYVWSIALACAVALDVPLAIAANAVKRYSQGLCSKKEMLLISFMSVSVFAIAFAFSFGFRILTRDLTFSVGSGDMLVNTVSGAGIGIEGVSNTESSTEKQAILYAALFNGVIPLLTSLSSFVISYFAYNPVGMKLAKLEKERVGIQTNILEVNQWLAELSDVKAHASTLIFREEDLQAAFEQQLDADAYKLKQMVRVLLMEKLGTAEGVTAMTEAGKELEEKEKPCITQGQKLPEYIKEQYEMKNGRTIIPMNEPQAA